VGPVCVWVVSTTCWCCRPQVGLGPRQRNQLCLQGQLYRAAHLHRTAIPSSGDKNAAGLAPNSLPPSAAGELADVHSGRCPADLAIELSMPQKVVLPSCAECIVTPQLLCLPCTGPPASPAGSNTTNSTASAVASSTRLLRQDRQRSATMTVSGWIAKSMLCMNLHRCSWCNRVSSPYHPGYSWL
jgi:hypothetical protein